jgi:hypothetical protein
MGRLTPLLKVAMPSLPVCYAEVWHINKYQINPGRVATAR